MFGEIIGEPLIDERLDDAFHLAVTQLSLCLAFKLRFRNFDTDDSSQAFADIFSLKILIVFLKLTAVYRVAVDGACQRGLETDQVGATLQGVDVISEGKDVFEIAVVPMIIALDIDTLSLTL